MVTHVFAAWIILDMMFSRHLDNVGSQGLLEEYDFIIGELLLVFNFDYLIFFDLLSISNDKNSV